MTHKKTLTLYNVFFPIWFIFLFPPLVFLVLIINFAIDTLVVRIVLKKMAVSSFKEIYQRKILKTWLFGFLADIIGVGFLFLFLAVAEDRVPHSITKAVMINPFSHPVAFLVVAFAILITAILIYHFNLFVFKPTNLTEEQRKKVAKLLAIFTAPYFFLLPTAWFI